jgi:hypothetical protein
MADPEILARIDAWLADGLIDEPTAARLRAAETQLPATPDGPPRHAGAVSPFGPTITVAETFGYLGTAFLLAAWHTLVLVGSADPTSDTARRLFDSLVPAIAFAVGGFALMTRGARLRRAAGVAFAVSTAHVATVAWFALDAATPGIGNELHLVLAAAAAAVVAAVYRAACPGILTQASLLVALVGLGAMVLGWADLLFPVAPASETGPAEGYPNQFRDPAAALLRVVLTAAFWIAWAVGVGILGRLEARAPHRAGDGPTAEAADRRAWVTRLAAGLAAVAGTASAVAQVNGYGPHGSIRSIEPWVGDLAVLAVSGVLLVLAFRNAAAYLAPAALGVLYALTDLNATYVAAETGTGTALLVEGVILLAVGAAAEQARRRLHRSAARRAPDLSQHHQGGTPAPPDATTPPSV